MTTPNALAFCGIRGILFAEWLLYQAASMLLENRWEARAAFLISIFNLISIGFTYLQVREARTATALLAHQTVVSHALEFDKSVFEHPELRPYFRQGKTIDRNDQLYEKVSAGADMLLDIIDSDIEHAKTSNERLDPSWEVSYKNFFHDSPQLCSVFNEHKTDYSASLQKLGAEACKP